MSDNTKRGQSHYRGDSYTWSVDIEGPDPIGSKTIKILVFDEDGNKIIEKAGSIVSQVATFILGTGSGVDGTDHTVGVYVGYYLIEGTGYQKYHPKPKGFKWEILEPPE